MNNTNKRRSGKRPVKRKFYGNQFTEKEETASSIPLDKKDNEPATSAEIVVSGSASRKKLSSANPKVDPLTSDEQPAYRIIDVNIFLKKLESTLCCGKCFGHVSITEKSLYGLSSSFQVFCTSCGDITEVRTCKQLGKKKNVPDVNRRSVFAMRLIGRGASHLQKFCSVMSLPAPVSQKAFDKINNRILEATAIVAKESTKRAADEEADSCDSTDITISGDGSWKTRGHSSQIGICSVIGGDTGKVIDTDVMSSYCKGCSSYKGRKTGRGYQKFLTDHKKFCKKNHTGSAGKMEVDGMIRIFQRSVAEKGVRYVSYIGDGDSSTFKNIEKNQPYGSQVPITKIECVGHIQKRMGTRLRKLKKSFGRKKLSDDKTIGGKGRLDPPNINKLTQYYGNAIRQHNKSVVEMRKAIWATYLHCSSTDSNPQHFFCPKHTKTWCGYNKAVAEGTVQSYKHSNTFAPTVMKEIKPIFKDLSEPKLLKRCEGGRTQNPNESFNALVWSICPKTSSASRTIAEIAVNISTVTFNDGDTALIKIMNELELDVSSTFIETLEKKVEKRMSIGDVRASETTKEARKAKKIRLAAENQQQIDEEGETYGPGLCDSD